MPMSIRLSTQAKCPSILRFAEFWQPISMARRKLSATVDNTFHKKIVGSWETASIYRAEERRLMRF
jgi:hypothetical protein